MKNKVLGLFALSVMVLTLFVGLTSALSVTQVSQFNNITVSFGSETATVNFNLTNNDGVDYDNLVFVPSNTPNVGSWSFSLTNISNGIVNFPASATLTFPKTFAGNITSSILVNDTIAGIPTGLLTFPLITVFVVGGPTELSDCSVTGNSSFIDLDIETPNVKGFGEDNDWYPLDEIEITVKVDNKAGEDLDNIAVGWGLWDLEDQSFVIDDEEKDFDLKKGKKQDVVISFKLEDPSDFEEDHDLVFLVWANGEGKDTDAQACASEINGEIDVQIDEFAVLDNFQYPETVQCTEDVTITADLWNVGDEDQELVYVLVTNKDLGLDQERIDIGDLDAFDNAGINFNFQVPLDADEKIYPLKFGVYSEDIGGIYENSLNDDKAEFTVLLTVKGGCIVEPDVSVEASLVSGGKAGEELVVEAKITNNGDKTATYSLETSGFSAWADSANVSESTFSLAPGKSRTVTITVDVKDDVSGAKTLDLEVLSGGELIFTQPVRVTIEGVEPGFLSTITGGVINQDNQFLWIVGIVNVVLVLSIITVAVRMMRRS